jgi:hypothetical protein
MAAVSFRRLGNSARSFDNHKDVCGSPDECARF